MPNSSPRIGSVQRALDILSVFTDRSPELGTTEIAALAGLRKSTAASLIYTLKANGYLSQNPDTRKYRLGLRLIERAAVVLNQIELRQVALPYLHQLRDQFDETVNLAVLDGPYMVYIERLLCTRALGMRSEVGRRSVAHSTALGKSIFACLPQAEVMAWIQQHGLPAITPHTITDADRFFTELDRTRAQGYGVDNEENEIGGRCIAAPVFDHTGKAIAAVSVSAPITRLPTSEIPRFSSQIRATAGVISHRLGHMPQPA